MAEIHATLPPSPLGRLARLVLILGALFSLYLVLHPFTPLAKAEIILLDIVQLQRSTHVLFLLLGAYLVSFFASPRKATLGSWVFLAFSLVPLYSFLFPKPPAMDLPLGSASSASWSGRWRFSQRWSPGSSAPRPS